MMKVNLKDLLPIQKEVNKIVTERLGRSVTISEFILAFNVELFEYFNAIGTWKWWKQSHVVDKEKVLDELADCFAFFLSAIDLQDQANMLKHGVSIIPSIETRLEEIIESLYGEDFGETKEERVNSLINIVGTDNEMAESTIDTLGRLGVAIHLATLLFDGITWEEITEAYRKKSEENIARQNKGY